ncbi:uncharacterized protein MELLADRAFT_112112 [Melampsora larici-populina 98AG31]|uniref:J domain-containing protein n=1 Tax=Melampsora larici-populina (strain 98AG31 / pathotype 3-4-7) TaxID=747676 RepID=F4S5F4_MELLP|nr:uncharacterized protein MELLADRAFT_112112 [Melampsora larici-populina 98AG31]EGG00171.1 hypothetical protein MELLADRAFT_112112 [Melampsora larici-populina 98AG31]
MPPKKPSQKKAPVAPVAHPIRHTRVTRASQAASRAASQVASQTDNSQQAEPSLPPPPGQRAPRARQAASRSASQVLSQTNDSQQAELSPPPAGQRAPRAFQTNSQVFLSTTNSQRTGQSPPSPSGQGVPRVFWDTFPAPYHVPSQTTDSQPTGPSPPPPPGRGVPDGLQTNSQVVSQTSNTQKTGTSAPPPPGQRVPRVFQAGSQLLSQTSNSQQTELSPPPPGQAFIKPQLRGLTKSGQKRSPDDEPSESSGSNTARKRSKIDPASSQIPIRKPRGRPRKVPKDSQISPPSQDSARIITDRKGKGKAKQALSSSSSDLRNSGRMPTNRKGKGKAKQPLRSSSSLEQRMSPVQNRASNRSPDEMPDLRSDENASTADVSLRAALKADEYREHFEIFNQVRSHLSQLLPDEAQEALQIVMDPEHALFIPEDHELDEYVKCWRKRIEKIDRAHKTVRRAHRVMLWSSVVEVITDVEEWLESWKPDRSPPQNQYAGRVELPDQWLMWKVEALVWMGDVHNARGLYPLLTPDSDSIDRRDRYRVEGLIEFSDRDYSEAIEYLSLAVDGSGDYFGQQSDRLEEELWKLITRAYELRDFEEKLELHLSEIDTEDEPTHLGLALKMIRDMTDQPMRLIELPMRLWLRETLCKLYCHVGHVFLEYLLDFICRLSIVAEPFLIFSVKQSIRAQTASDVAQDMVCIRKEVQEINRMTGFRFHSRNQVSEAYKQRVIAAYLYLARSEETHSKLHIARHNYKVVEKLHREGWGAKGLINYDHLSEEIQAGCALRDPDSRQLSPVSPDSPDSPLHASHPPTPNFSRLSTRIEGDRLPTFYDYKRYYATLGLGPHVDYWELRTRYDKLGARSCHSDYFHIRLEEAFNVLSDPSKRQEYDQKYLSVGKAGCAKKKDKVKQNTLRTIKKATRCSFLELAELIRQRGRCLEEWHSVAQNKRSFSIWKNKSFGLDVRAG